MALEGAERIDEFIGEAKVFFLATVDGDKPKNRPLGFHLLKDGKIYFGVGNHKDVFKQMAENPFVEIVALVETDFLRYYGKAVFEETYDFAESIVRGNEFLESIYNDETGFKLAIFHLEEATAEIRNITGEIMESYNF
ncbi:pyridoxamine 5'-phosphate oxidase family protein [Methanobrevibacter sp.]|uniref:pyridoxamine 5'-phosphate oxidase family protein n=1 Tax=Methanobrevibacter sp. TaxID=66852 RepID=UPI0025D87782|nr:pyridoxamine 5'-phosphate oxidase family protein [Methanobrevibacter sp.]MBQ2831942.1 pyridoxamine 5'-phosphate oxidase family protein [Methanobrevibacter sp.]